MRNHLIPAVCMAAALLAGCAKPSETSPNDSEIRRVESWVQYQKTLHPEYLWKQTPLGCYILEDEQGTGTVIGSAEDSPYVHLSYLATDLDGNIIDASDEATARRLGTFKTNYYYGPTVLSRGEGQSYVGEDEIVEGMRVGGKRTVLVPGWLMTNKRYKNAKAYQSVSASAESVIYSVEIHDVFTNVYKWQVDSIETFLKRNYPAASLDTTGKYGFYYYQLTPPDDPDEVINMDDKVYLNYTAMLLNGSIFDSTYEEVTKDNNLTNRSSYGPTYITRGETYSDTTMGSDNNSIIDGFAYACHKMKHGESGIAVFYSAWGYGNTGTEKVIPPYSPLMFKLDVLTMEEQKKITGEE